MNSARTCSRLIALCASIMLACGGATSPGNDQPDASSGTGGQGGSGTGGAAGSGGASGGATGGGGSAGAGGTATGGAGGGGGAGGRADSGVCNQACTIGRTCCGGQCVNPANDPTNCGGCGVRCGGSTPYCGGSCMATPCDRDGAACANGGSCCGSLCCAQGQLCCDPQGPLDRGPVCFTPTVQQTTCPAGCAPLCVSDRSLKREIEPVDPFAVLDAVSKLPVSTWSYRTDPQGVRHMGPMAQDFKAAFGLGDTDRAYYGVDAHGVTLAAVQALYELSLQQSLRIDALERDNRVLQSRVDALSGRATMHSQP